MLNRSVDVIYMTCAPTVFVVIMIREINSKDEQGNANSDSQQPRRDAATETCQYSQTIIYVLRRLAIAAAAAAEQFSDTIGVMFKSWSCRYREQFTIRY